ncbi:hypothetical protein [Dyella sp.]|jgi:hypothetical protein|uniref:hypothetical protein n=1 Tax=Dyella sp. TaxID=1869338 RepID=UPI002CDFA512|nr:hypothetical protein [Dyella sp.]HTC28905.1 hypothetical protein [Dyella sp.]
MTKFAPLAAALAFGLASAAMATPQNTPNAGTPTADQAPAAANAPQSNSPIKPGDRSCIRDTGSLIKPKPGQCLPVAGNSYSKQDIDRTGARTLGPALRDLDPAITLRH